MTGGGGRSRSRYSNSPAAAAKVACASLTDHCSISSPNLAAIAKLHVGSVLGVELRATPQSVVATDGATIVGGLVPVNLADLIACLKLNYRFNATVIRIDSGYCEVHIRCVGRA